MKVFISWSGERSRQVAELLHTWIECVIQAVEPWVSSSDIDRGALWFTQIIDELSTTTHGIICLTRENKEKPWILFEAGALAKGLASSRIYTLLVDLNPEDIRDPLAQFNHTRPTEVEMFKLVSSINRGLEGKGLKEGILANAFKTYWPQFQESFDKIINETEEATAPKVERPQEDILSEILNSVRGIDKRVRQIEDKTQVDSVKRSFVQRGRIRDTPEYQLALDCVRTSLSDAESLFRITSMLPQVSITIANQALIKAKEDLYRSLKQINESSETT
ncbi:MAG: hypothetical protein ACRYG7_05645 [Janthinobacterium lividum]